MTTKAENQKIEETLRKVGGVHIPKDLDLSFVVTEAAKHHIDADPNCYVDLVEEAKLSAATRTGKKLDAKDLFLTKKDFQVAIAKMNSGENMADGLSGKFDKDSEVDKELDVVGGGKQDGISDQDLAAELESIGF